MIKLRGIEKSFKTGAGETFVLRRINAEVEAGEFVTIMGPSGAGKSTFIQLLLGLRHPTEGRVLVNGIDACEGVADCAERLSVTSRAEAELIE